MSRIKSGPVKIKLQHPNKRLLKLLIRQGVTKRIDRTVQVAQPITQRVKIRIHTAVAKALYGRADMPRRPAQHKRPHNKCDGFQGLSRPIFRPRLLPLRETLLPTIPATRRVPQPSSKGANSLRIIPLLHGQQRSRVIPEISRRILRTAVLVTRVHRALLRIVPRRLLPDIAHLRLHGDPWGRRFGARSGRPQSQSSSYWTAASSARC